MGITTFNTASKVMNRAWAIYRKYYNTCDTHKRQIACALRMAWAELKKTQSVKVLCADTKAKIASLESRIEMLSYRSLQYRNVSKVSALHAEISSLRGSVA